MKKIIMIVAGVSLMLAVFGCAGIGARAMVQGLPVMANVPKNKIIPAGFVPVHIQNPDLLSQEVCLFEGSTSVQIIPDGERGGWKYSRPAFACYLVEGANSESNWYGYSQIALPRNFSFVVASRIIGVFGGKGQPYFQYYRTGADPFAQTYTSITPTQQYVNCGALVQLQRQLSSVQSLNITVDIDFRPIGAAITNRLGNAVYGGSSSRRSYAEERQHRKDFNDGYFENK